MINPRISVLPDPVMREANRDSLNRIPDFSDYEPGNRLTDLMREMGDPVVIHRKPWEYALCVDGLRQLGAITPNARALAVGAGYERPLFYFANCVEEMVATDLYDNPHHEGQPDMLTNPQKYAPFPYREDHLRVLQMGGDNLAFPDNHFDFVFCLSSIEHFGPRSVQKKSFQEMVRVTKPEGHVCIMTELILNDATHEEYFTLDGLEEMFLQEETAKLVGGDFDLRISQSLVENPVNLDTSKFISRSPHLVLYSGGVLWTSMSIFLQKTA